MIVGSIKEDLSFEKRVSITPETAKNIIIDRLKIWKSYIGEDGITDEELADIEANEVINTTEKEEELMFEEFSC